MDYDVEIQLAINNLVSSDCQPKYLDIDTFDKVIGKSQQQIAELNLPRYYASELLKLSDQHPPYNVLEKNFLQMTPDERSKFIEFSTIVTKLLEVDDTCDKKGIEFIAKFIGHYKPNSEEFDFKNENIQTYVSSLLSFESKVMGLAKKAINI